MIAQENISPAIILQTWHGDCAVPMPFLYLGKRRTTAPSFVSTDFIGGMTVKKGLEIFALSAGIISLIAAAAIVLFILAYPLLVFSLEDKLMKNELDNTYINDNYAGWQTVSIDKIGTFKLPEHWVLCQEDDQYTLKNKNGDVFAYGAVVGDPTSKYEGVKSYASSVIGEPIERISFQYNNSFSGIGGSQFFSLVVAEDPTQNLLRCIQLENHSLRPLEEGTTDFVLIIDDGAESYEDLIEIAEAVVYSYVYSYSYE